MLEKSIEKLIAFRKKLHELIPSYRDAAMDLVDALSTNTNAGSVTELSENRFFRRRYNSLTKVIHSFLVANKQEEQTVDPQACLASEQPPVNNEVQPDKDLQQAIRWHIARQCPDPERRNFFYSPAMSRQRRGHLPKSWRIEESFMHPTPRQETNRSRQGMLTLF